MLKLRELRRQNYLSQVDLAEKTGLTVYTICRLECGRHRPTMRTVRKLAKGLGVKPGDIAASQDIAGHHKEAKSITSEVL